MAELRELVAPERTALVVVDVQNDFCHEDGSIAARGMDVAPIHAMVPRLEGLIQAAHAGNVPVIFIRTEHGLWTDAPAWQERLASRTSAARRPICREGTWGAEFYRLQPSPGDRVVVKHRYSAFLGTDLDLILRSRGIETVLCTGVTTNVCVESTARHGFMLNYRVVMVSDCCAAPTEEEHRSALWNIGTYFGTVHGSEEIMAAWGVAPLPTVS